MTREEIDALTRRAMNNALSAVLEDREPLTIVDSPPGAGKTYFCERLIGLAICSQQIRVCYVAPKIDQGTDMAERLLALNAPFSIDVLVGKDRSEPEVLAGRVQWTSDCTSVGSPGRLLISNPSKLCFSRGQLSLPFDLMIVDEAYQIAVDDFLPIADFATTVVLVGDPGQLAPTVTVDTAQFEGGGSRIHWAVPREILRLRPETPVFQLPATRRLVQDTVEIVQPSFYPSLPFASAANSDDRRVEFSALGLHDPMDAALDMLADGRSMLGLQIAGSSTSTDERDVEVEVAIVQLVRRILERRAVWKDHRALTAHDIGVVDSHVLSGNAIRAALQASGLTDVKVATPELWQGRQVPLMIVKHPLNIGTDKPSTFDLDPGRFCVMLSRHLLGCIIIGRDSVEETLTGYMHDSRPTPVGAIDKAWEGYRAHASVWATLSDRGRILRIAA